MTGRPHAYLSSGKALLTLLLLLALGAGCRAGAATPSPTAAATPSAPAPTVAAAPEVVGVAHPRFYYYYYSYVYLPPSPAPGATPTPPPSTVLQHLPPLWEQAPPATTPVAQLGELADIVLVGTAPAYRTATELPPDAPAAMGEGLAGKVDVQFSYAVSIYRSPTAEFGRASLYVTVKNLMEGKLFTGLTFYYAYRDEQGAIRQEGIATLSVGLRAGRVVRRLTTNTDWATPAGLDMARTTAEMKVISIFYQDDT